jgi:hypothetical protein
MLVSPCRPRGVAARVVLTTQGIEAIALPGLRSKRYCY